MSIYPGTAVEQSYAQGFALGREYAQADRKDQRPFASSADEFRAEALQAARSWKLSGRDHRAWKLGIARGYREEARSFKWGRWGL
jgi:hypothetical protein